MPAKKPRKMIGGKVYIQCAVKTCGKWFRFEQAKNRSYRCKDCWAEYRKGLAEKRKEGKPNNSTMKSRMQAKIKKELRGEIAIGDLFSGVSEEKIKALQTCNVEALLRME